MEIFQRSSSTNRQTRTMNPPTRTVPSMLRFWATREPDTPAFIFIDASGGRRVLSRDDVFRLSSRYAAMLRSQGVGEGVVVCNTLPSSPERLLTDLGVLLAGAVTMHGKVGLASGEDFIRSLQDSRAFAVILDPQNTKGAKGFLDKRADTQATNRQTRFRDLPALKQVLEVQFGENSSGQRPFLQLLEKADESYVADVTPRDPAVIWTTSGSTGFYKLVPFNHDLVVALGDQLCQAFDVCAGDVIYNPWHLGWSAGFPSIYLAQGNTRLLPDESSQAGELPLEATWSAICRERCSVALLSGAQVLQLIQHCQEFNEHKRWKLRVAVSAGQPLLKKHMEAIGKIADYVIAIYGTTESCVISRKVITNKADYENNNNGAPFTGVELRVVNTEGEGLPEGEMGEILMRSPLLFEGYLGNQEATRQAFTKDGWFRTGDLGYFSEKGEIFTVCRAKNGIMRGADVVYPGWLESQMTKCPGVHDVIIVPVPDPVLYQEICACVVPRAGSQVTSEDMEKFVESLCVKKNGQASMPVPKYYVFFDVFPKIDRGKPSRQVLAAQARQSLGLREDIACQKQYI